MPHADDQAYLARLEAGARFLASGADSSSERDVHRAAADLYARRQYSARAWAR